MTRDWHDSRLPGQFAQRRSKDYDNDGFSCCRWRASAGCEIRMTDAEIFIGGERSDEPDINEADNFLHDASPMPKKCVVEIQRLGELVQPY